MNIFVVEDEPPILRDIIAVINSYQQDYQIIGKASNGQEAMDFLKVYGSQTDVMITDIQIPVLSGLELIEYTHRSLPHILNIILTGFSNFDYAHTAIKYGVYDYLLKPIDEEELGALLHKAYAQKCTDYMHRTPSLPDKAFAPTDTGYQLALISAGSFPSYADLYIDSLPQVWKSIDLQRILESSPHLKNNFWIIDGISPAEKIVLFSTVREEHHNSYAHLAQIFDPLLHTGHNITITIDTRFFGIRNIHQSILNLRSYAGKQIRLEKPQILFFGSRISKKEPLNLTPFYSQCQRLANVFSQKKQDSFETGLKAYLNKMHSLSLPVSTVYQLLQELIRSCLMAADDSLLSGTEINVSETAGDALALSDTYLALYENLRSVFLSFFEEMSKDDQIIAGRSSMLLKVDTYIKENFTTPISTGTIAAEFGFTPAYLSQIFRAYKSVTPADYIVRLRIEKAEELLILNPGCRIKDIAHYVGYEDSLYFSKVFKRITGLSPRQFMDGKRPV